MSAVKFNNDKETAIEFHQLARDFGSKYPQEIKDIYLDKMQTKEGKEFVNDYLKHKTSLVKTTTEKSLLTKKLTAIEENRPVWKNNYSTKAHASELVNSAVKDDVAAMVRKEPHPQLTQENYQFKHFSAEVSVENSIAKGKAAELQTSLKTLMSNLLKKGMSQDEIKQLSTPAPEMKVNQNQGQGITKKPQMEM